MREATFVQPVLSAQRSMGTIPIPTFAVEHVYLVHYWTVDTLIPAYSMILMPNIQAPTSIYSD